jgi:hypothetical protein
MLDAAIIDPASTEFNRGSFCYLPYIFYSSLKRSNLDIAIFENVTAADIDQIPPAKTYFVTLWSYPQIDLSLVLNRFLPNQPKFFGYEPLIDDLKLLKRSITSEEILEGIEHYPGNFHDFKTILLSDCDMHLKKHSGQVYPLFTSYGCPNGCTFCPSTINCNRKRLVLPLEKVEAVLEACNRKQIRNIHFTDEDFFFDIDRANTILKRVAYFNDPFQLISLGSAIQVKKFIQRYGEDILAKAGMKLIEIGLETADPSLADTMSKAGHNACLWLAEYAKTSIFWLTMTFFPGETIKSLNTTGAFLHKYGYKLSELYGRIQTNSTEGGLGQFFQLYHGTELFGKRNELGIQLNERPIRLLPSFAPYSFLQSEVNQVGEIDHSNIDWFNLYRLPPGLIKIEDLLTVQHHLDLNRNKASVSDILTYLAICARLRIIT